MATVINRTTKQLIYSVNTPDYNESDWIINPDLSALDLVPQKYWKISGDSVIEMDSGEKATVDAAASTQATINAVQNIVRNAKDFGSQIMDQYTVENVLLGITQAGMTRTVREYTAEVRDCLSTGSLYDAMQAIRDIPIEHKDATFITDARMLVVLNKIEVYLGITPSQSL